MTALHEHKLLRPFVQLLRQGISPEKIALTIALGIVLGVTPVLGSTLALCTLASVLLRLNLPAIQLVNAAVYPLQFLLLIPFYRLGACLFHADATAISLSGVMALIKTGVLNAIQTLWVITLHALVAWTLIGAVTGVILYLALVPVLRGIWRKLPARESA